MKTRERKIHQFDMEGKFVRSFRNIKKCCKELKLQVAKAIEYIEKSTFIYKICGYLSFDRNFKIPKSIINRNPLLRRDLGYESSYIVIDDIDY